MAHRGAAFVIFRAIVIALLCTGGYAAGYFQDRKCPDVPNTQYQGAHEQEGRLKCVYVVNVTRTMVRGLTQQEGGR